MAKIIKDTKQEQALAEVEQNLHQIGMINKLLTDTNSYKIIADDVKAAKIDIDEALSDKVSAILKAQKTKLTKATKSIAAKYRIELEDSEQALLNA